MKLFLTLMTFLLILNSCVSFNSRKDLILSDSIIWQKDSNILFKPTNVYYRNMDFWNHGFLKFSSNDFEISVYQWNIYQNSYFIFPIFPTFIIHPTMKIFGLYKTIYNFAIYAKSDKNIDFNDIAMVVDDKDTVKLNIGIDSSLNNQGSYYFINGKIEKEIIDGKNCYFFSLKCTLPYEVDNSVKLIFNDVTVDNVKINIPNLNLEYKYNYYFDEEFHYIFR